MGILNCSDSKSALRSKHKSNRRLMDKNDKLSKDFKIFQNFILSDLFLQSDVILTYVSSEIEVDTREIIEYSLKVGKKVAVPVSISDDFSLKFYFINSMNDLHVGYFSILEPDVNICELCNVNKLSSLLCIVPGLAFDFSGHRVGYGKGYYDRFLCKHQCKTVGFCYETDLIESVNKNQYDIPVDSILTEKRILKVLK